MTIAALSLLTGAAALIVLGLLWWPLPIAVLAIGVVVTISEIRRWPTIMRPW